MAGFTHLLIFMIRFVNWPGRRLKQRGGRRREGGGGRSKREDIERV